MSLDASSVQALGVALASFIAFLIAAFLFLNAWGERMARSMGYAMIFIFLWALFGYLYYVPDSIPLEQTMRTISILAESFAFTLLIRFAFLYKRERIPLTEGEKLVLDVSTVVGASFAVLSALDLFYGTHLMVGQLLGPAKITLAPQPGPFFLYLALYAVYTAIIVAAMTWQRAMRETGPARRSSLILGISITLSTLFASTGFLPWYGIDMVALGVLRALALPLFGVAAFYAITNYQLFKLQVAAAESFIFAIWGFSFFRIVLDRTLSAAVPDVILFIALLTLGIFLVRSVRKQERDRIELRRLSADLQDLNESLEIKVAERTAALKRSNEHIATVFEYLPVGVLEMTSSGRIVRINKTAQEFFGISNDVLDQQIERVPRLASAFVGKTEERYDVEITDPRKRELQIMRAPLNMEEGRGEVAVVHDVTEERALARAKEEFVSVAAHQLRTPLTAINWALSILGESRLTKTQKEGVETSMAGARRMSKVVEGLLLAARTSEGVHQYRFEDTDVADMLAQLIPQYAQMAKHQGIKFETDIASDVPHLQADPTMLSFALQNLVDNALKYTKKGGQVNVLLASAGGNLVFEVTDTGIGITPEEGVHLFEKFNRGREAITMHTDGSGLGLFVVKSVAAAHGGTVTYSSVAGKGTTFTMTLPVVSENTLAKTGQKGAILGI